MILETLLTAALETGIGLLAEVGFGDALRDLKDRLTNTSERQRRDAFERAFAHAREAVGDDPITPLLEHRPFLEEVVKRLLDPTSSFDIRATGAIWQDRLPKHTRALQQFFSDLEKYLFADDIWGPILERYQEWRFRDEVRQALQARQLDISAQKLVHEVSIQLSGSGAIATSGGTSAGAGGVAVAGNVGQIVLQQIIMQSGARTHSSDLRQRYLARLHDLCCALPLAALGSDLESKKPVTLDQVYIELNTTTEVPTDLLARIQQGEFRQWPEVEQRLRQGRRGPLIDGEARIRRRGEREDDMPPLPILDALRLSPQMALLGEAGAGKSTVARIVIARLIEGNPSPGVPGELLPILVVLRDLVPRLGTLDFNTLPAARHDDALADAVRDQMLADLDRLDASGFADDLLDALNLHRCLLVFDGLDEVPQGLRGLIRRAVAAAIKRYRPPRIIVTCRTRSYVGEATLPGFQRFELASFSDEQIEAFAHAWYNAQKALGHVDAVQAEARAVDLAQKALAPALRELAANPMLMTAMAIIHQQETRLPEERVRLYDKAVGLLLHRWQREKVEDTALAAFLRDDRLLRRVMERLGYEAHLARPRGQPGESYDLPRHQAQDIIEEYLSDANQAREFLDYVDQRAGLLIGRGDGLQRPAAYTFPHRTFQEYLAGCYLLTGSDSDRVRAFYARAAEGDHWNLVVQLAAEELLYNNPRNGEREVLHLAYNLLADAPTNQQEQRASLWSGQMALLVNRGVIERDTGSPTGGQRYLQRLLPCMRALLASELTTPERRQAEEILGYLRDLRFDHEARYLPKDDLLGFVEISPGPFLMGSDQRCDLEAYDYECEQHEVTLTDYYIARYPVTVAQFQAFVEDSGYQPEDNSSVRGVANHPVMGITWYEALKYCDWLTERLRGWAGTPEPLATRIRNEGWMVTLPSEAEWEKAARGTDGRLYPWGDKADRNRANYADTRIKSTSAVGCFPTGASPYGVEDLSGNVWEWTRSLWGTDFTRPAYHYPYQPTDGREDVSAPRDIRRVVRGGAFSDDLGYMRCASRYWFGPSSWHWHLGFRVVVRPCR